VYSLVALGTISLVLSLYWLRVDAMLAFYSALSRAFELMVGSVLALSVRTQVVSSVLRELLAATGLLLITVSAFTFTATTPFPGIAALAPCLGAALIIWTGAQAQTFTSQLLSLRPVRWIGGLSFSLYLWHWPVLVTTRHWLLGEPNAWQATTAVCVSILLAWLSLHYVELPIRRAKLADRQLLGIGAACMVLALAATFALGLPSVARHPTAAEAKWQRASGDISPATKRCHEREDNPIPYADRCVFGKPSQPVRTAVWADSHGVEIAYALGESAAARGQAVAQVTSTGCPPALDLTIRLRPSCVERSRETLAALASDPVLERVILVARYEGYVKSQAASLEAGLRSAITSLTAAGKQVYLVDPIPTYDYPVPAALAALQRRNQAPELFGQTPEYHATKNRATLDMLARLTELRGVTRVSTTAALCPAGRCLAVAEGEPLYFDSNHLSMAGARLLVAKTPQMLPD